MVKVKKTNGGRIFMLKFESYEDKYFFWMQTPDESEDEVFVKKLNDAINSENPESK
jgi:26S proteasome regulatory subunit N13